MRKQRKFHRIYFRCDEKNLIFVSNIVDISNWFGFFPLLSLGFLFVSHWFKFDVLVVAIRFCIGSMRFSYNVCGLSFQQVNKASNNNKFLFKSFCVPVLFVSLLVSVPALKFQVSKHDDKTKRPKEIHKTELFFSSFFCFFFFFFLLLQEQKIEFTCTHIDQI